MTRWARGQAELDQLLESRQLQKIAGGAPNGEPLLDKARRTLATATDIAEADPDSAFALGYDAARYAGTALLAQQGLRPTTTGGHYAVEVALRAQFGDGFRPFGTLRRRRNELEYPTTPGETASIAETREAIATADTLITAAEQLLPTLGLY
jgi:hypothetical protein